MKNDFTMTFLVDQNRQQVFDAINSIRKWWSEDFKGTSEKTEDEFEVWFGDIHYSKQKLVEAIPGERITWLVTDSQLTFLQNQNEWTGTKPTFHISEEGTKTRIVFTHSGLLPAIECFNNCSQGWMHYLQNSLIPLVTTGVGKANKKENLSRKLINR
jgi:hypothetical protein